MQAVKLLTRFFASGPHAALHLMADSQRFITYSVLGKLNSEHFILEDALRFLIKPFLCHTSCALSLWVDIAGSDVTG